MNNAHINKYSEASLNLSCLFKVKFKKRAQKPTHLKNASLQTRNQFTKIDVCSSHYNKDVP